MSDFIRELLIEYHMHMIPRTSGDKCKKHMDEMYELIRGRSARAISEMESKRGLR
jgi:diadenosine tetraphosphate (Ap4A) HIT family hydrolase